MLTEKKVRETQEQCSLLSEHCSKWLATNVLIKFIKKTQIEAHENTSSSVDLNHFTAIAEG